MFSTSKKMFLTAIVAFALGLSLTLTSAAQAQQTSILTVTGNVENPNRGAFDKTTDVFFEYNEVAFDKAMTFDAASLEKLPMVKVKADFPLGGDVHTYEGPLLADVLAAAGAKGEEITIQALDGYAMIVPLAEIIDQGAVLAMKRNGEAFSIGGFGPTQIVFPRAERADLKDMPDDRWVWSVFHIKVE
ncbi:MAG: molybdopterin-dependent oxidoreductase [Pseudomonadota bacterium]